MSLWLSGLGCVAAAAIGAVVLAAGVAEAQAPSPPPPSPEVAAITSCLCLQQSVAALAAAVAAKQAQLGEIQRQLADLDAQLASERPHVDIDNPDSVARYKALLERHDDTYRRSTGPLSVELTAAAGRYNARVGEYNQDCANHPFNSELMGEIRASLVCLPAQ